MPIVNLDIVPELMTGDRESQYQQISAGITDAIVASTGAPPESVHVLINEVAHTRYAVGGSMLAERMASPKEAGPSAD